MTLLRDEFRRGRAAVFIALPLLTLAVLIGLPQTCQARDLYVSPTGSDASRAPTNIKTPLRTINKAAQLARAGDTVYVRAGTYRETVTPAHSGLPGKPIVFRPYKNERVSVRGTDLIPPGSWKRGDGAGNLFETPYPAGERGDYVSANNQSMQAFADGKMLLLARWPREAGGNLSFPTEATMDRIVSSEDTGKKAPGPQYPVFRTVIHDADFDQPDGRWAGAKIWVNTGEVNGEQDGNGQTGIVVATDREARTITVELDAPAAAGDATPRNFQIGKGSRYYLFDPPTVDGLLYDGYWWRDRAGGRLYVRLPDGQTPVGRRIEVKRRDWAFNLDGKSHVTVQNVHIFGASITTDLQAGNGVGSGGSRKGSIAPAHHVVLDGLNAEYVTHFTDQTGHLQTQWSESSGIILSGSDNVIKNCDIAWSAGNGLVVIGQRSKAVNNIIHDTNYTAAEGGGICLGRIPQVVSLDHEIARNTVYNCGIEGIEFSALKNSANSKSDIRARIHHNLVYNTVLQSADSGGIKAFGSDGGWTRIDHNVIHSIGGPDVSRKYVYYGIYLDYPDKEGGYIIDHNLVYNTPTSLNINGMKNVEIYNNTFIARPEVARSPINDSGPGGAEALRGVIIRNTLGNREFRGIDGKGAVLSNNLITAADDWFMDAANPDLNRRDYRLKAATPAAAAAINTGADAAPFNDALPPDIGAYEQGKPMWRAGAERASRNPSAKEGL